MVEQGKVLIIDGNNLLHRVYWTAKALNKGDDNNLFHIYIFLNSLKSYIELFNPRKIVVCWDFREKQVENYRKLLDENYKAQRDDNKMQEVYVGVPIILKLLESLGVFQINPLTLEADDIIFWLATKKFPNESIIISTDTDMYQLISSELKGNIIYNPKKKREITPLYLKEHYNVLSGIEYIFQKALRGDKSDNLKGIKGIRSSKIQDILSILKIDYDLNSLLESSLLKEDELEIFKHNLQMMKLDIRFIGDEEIEWYEKCLDKPKKASKEEFTLIIKELKFWKIYKKIDYWYKTFDRIDYNDIFQSIFDFE